MGKHDSEAYVGWSSLPYLSKFRNRTSLVSKLLLTTFYLTLVFCFFQLYGTGQWPVTFYGGLHLCPIEL